MANASPPPGIILEDVTSQRPIGTTFQNTTGRHLLMSVYAKAGAGPGDFEFRIAEDVAFTSKVFLDVLGNNIVVERTRVVPPGYYYKLTSTTAVASEVYSWMEG